MTKNIKKFSDDLLVLVKNAGFTAYIKDPAPWTEKMWLARNYGEKKSGRGSGMVAVAIDRDRGSQNALKWAIDNLLQKGQTAVLIHVKVKSSSFPNSALPSPSEYILLAGVLFSGLDTTSLIWINKYLNIPSFLKAWPRRFINFLIHLQG